MVFHHCIWSCGITHLTWDSLKRPPTQCRLAELWRNKSVPFRILRGLHNSKRYTNIPRIEIILSTKGSLQQPLVCLQIIDSNQAGYCDSKEEYQHRQSSFTWHNSSHWQPWNRHHQIRAGGQCKMCSVRIGNNMQNGGRQWIAFFSDCCGSSGKVQIVLFWFHPNVCKMLISTLPSWPANKRTKWHNVAIRPLSNK